MASVIKFLTPFPFINIITARVGWEQPNRPISYIYESPPYYTGVIDLPEGKLGLHNCRKTVLAGGEMIHYGQLSI